MKLRTPFLVALAASIWAIIGALMFDSIGTEVLAGSEQTRWGLLMNPMLVSSAMISSSILWTMIARISRNRPKVGYSIAALVSPIPGVFMFVGVWWLLMLGDLDAQLALISALFLFLGAFYFTWPVSIGTAITCYLITRAPVETTSTRPNKSWRINRA